MADVMDDPIQAIIDRAKGELRAVTGQVTAMQHTKGALEDTLKATQGQVSAAQGELATASGKIADAEKRASEIIAGANRDAQAIREKTTKDIAAERAQHGKALDELHDAHAKQIAGFQNKIAAHSKAYLEVKAQVEEMQRKLGLLRRQAAKIAES